MSIVIAIANQKGGVGKTTTAINLGAALGALEKRVLLVDCDPQGNATRGLGEQASPPHLYHVLVGDAPASRAVRPTSFSGLSLLPSDRELVGVEVEFVGSEEWERRLRTALHDVIDAFDYVFLDCPPSLGHLTVNALAAADRLLVPLQCEYFALEGISELVATVRRVQTRINPPLQIGGVILTMFDERTNLSREVAEEARRHFPGLVYDAMVPRNIRLAEAPSHGLPILQYDIKSKGAEAYLRSPASFSGGRHERSKARVGARSRCPSGQ
ncbi:MAG: ParA family protein [Thermoanaerobaculia bacterium]|nr:ParA family protein [Thermoanaerobaculia bacterium]